MTSGGNSGVGGVGTQGTEVARADEAGRRDDNENLPHEGSGTGAVQTGEDLTAKDVPANLREVFQANPELPDAWRDAQKYRERLPQPSKNGRK